MIVVASLLVVAASAGAYLALRPSAPRAGEAAATPRRVPNPTDTRLGGFWAFSWSPDGRRLAGWSGRLNEHPGIVIHTIESGEFERVTEFGSNPIWLKDDRRLLFSYQDKLYIVDSETKKVRELSLPLPTPSRLDGYGISSDNRLLYYGLATKEADVWLLDIE